MRHSTLMDVHPRRREPEDERDTVDRVRGVDDAAFAAWLAVFALGLAYSQRSEASRQLELEEAAGGCVGALRHAHARLLATTVAEPPRRLAALHLLRGAIIGAELLDADAAAVVEADAAPVTVSTGCSPTPAPEELLPL
jgi:hypothetical protein